MADRAVSPRWAMLFLEVLTVNRQPLTDKKRRGFVRCVKTLKALTHLKPSRRFLSVNSKSSKKSMTDRVVSSRWAMLFFEILPYTYKKRGVIMCVKR